MTNLKLMRLLTGMKQYQFAGMLRTSQPYASQVEDGYCANPKPEWLEIIRQKWGKEWTWKGLMAKPRWPAAW